MDGPMDGYTNGWMDGWMDGWVDGKMEVGWAQALKNSEVTLMHSIYGNL